LILDFCVWNVGKCYGDLMRKIKNLFPCSLFIKQAVAQIEMVNNRITVAVLSDRYYQERIAPKLVKPEQVLGHINRLNACLGKMFVEDVTGKHVNDMYQTDLKRGYSASTNKLREHTLRIFGYATAQHLIPYNPAQWLDVSYAGGKQESRERNLSPVSYTHLRAHET
jgi:hypothetical protein